MINSIPSAGSAPFTGLGGINSGIDRAIKAANDIAHASAQGSNQLAPKLGAALVELKKSEHQIVASAAVIKSADDVLGTLIDISV